MVKRCFKVPVVIFDGNVDQQDDANDAQNADPSGAVRESDLGHRVLCAGEKGEQKRSGMSPRVQESKRPRVQESKRPRVKESKSPSVQESKSPRVLSSKRPRVHESTSLNTVPSTACTAYLLQGVAADAKGVAVLGGVGKHQDGVGQD